MSKAENSLKQIEKFGQSVWLDYIRRHLLTSVEFKRMLAEDGLKGMTSNPTIFENAIAGSTDYDEQLKSLLEQEKEVDEIYEALSLADVQRAADAFRPLWEKSGGRFGYVSYEVSPLLADDTDRTLTAARRYFHLVDRPNLMIKVPGTPAGIPAIEQLIAEGWNINITLMFSLKHYDAVAEAYIRGLERRLRGGQPVQRIASVASVFVSRVETLVDNKLDARLTERPDDACAALKGKAAVANAKLIYERFKQIFYGERFAEVRKKGAWVQRPLWASTGTKNHVYSDIKYVQELIGPETVNTMPPATMDAFRDHGKPRATLEEGLDQARETVHQLAAAGIDLTEVGEELQREGVDLFAKSFEALRAVIKGRRDAAVQCAIARQQISAPTYEDLIRATHTELDEQQFPARLWKKDPSLWKKDYAGQQGIRNALGWLTVAEMMTERVGDLKAFAREVKDAGLRDVVLLGMGGSSLCPELLARTFPSAPGYPTLHVLDSTVPGRIRAIEGRIDPAKTLFIVASKSGGTIETLSHYRYFFEAVKKTGAAVPGANFAAITDAGTSLETTAREHRFRRIFLNPSDIGGRYSALSFFGLVPAALIGIEVEAMLDRALRMMHSSAGCVRAEHNPGVSLGAFLGAMYNAGRDKVTFIVAPGISGFGLWAEQLIAESTGKEGKGLIPICGETVGEPESYGTDRAFAHLSLKQDLDEAQERACQALQRAGMPVVTISIADRIDLGEEFLRWEIATATAGAIMGINAFDQPNVQESKDNTNRLLAEFEKTGTLPGGAPAAETDQFALYPGAPIAHNLKSARNFDELLGAFFALRRRGDYFAIMAYLAESPEVEREAAEIRGAVRNRTHLATTFGYGPRFLHSTGQLHKGGPNTGLFLQITQVHRERIPIPGVNYDFALLNEAQHLGDFRSLESHHRRILRVHLRGDIATGMRSLREAVVSALG